MKMLRYTYLACAVLTGGLAIIQCLRYGTCGLVMIAYLVSVLPTVAFICAHASTRRVRGWTVHGIAIITCLVALGVWGFGTVVAEIGVGIDNATRQVTDLRRPDETVRDFWDRALVSHFPRPIPSQATDVRFSFRPKFLQGGTRITLAYSLPPWQDL